MPPWTLLDYPPIATLTNGYLTALNELRSCAPISIQKTLANYLSASLVTVGNHLLNYKSQNFKILSPEAKSKPDNEKHFEEMCHVRTTQR
jgi:hypothetical protein